MANMPTIQWNTRLPPDLKQAVDEAAYRARTSINRWLIEAIREKLERDAAP